MLLCAVAAMSFVAPQARRARERVSGFVPRACQGQPEEPPFLVGQRVEGLYGESLVENKACMAGQRGSERLIGLGWPKVQAS